MTEQDEVDVVIVGAGISGINMAYRLQTESPGLSYTVLESRSSMGGTWDLFKYPGLRSDSDMYTLGFPFEPWTGEKSIADGPDILRYVKDTAVKYGIDQHIQYDTSVESADWSNAQQRWTVQVSSGGRSRTVQARFVYMASGYYSYDNPYNPTFAGRESFRGQVIHPQHWPTDLDYTGKKVVVIGSGATAVTLVPALVKGGAEQVTMLQRTPTYILPLPGKDLVALKMRDRMKNPQRAYQLTRWRNIVQTIGFYQFCRKLPGPATRMLTSGPRVALRGSDAYDPKHFTPPYKPWDQRLCIIPDGDLFRTVKDGGAQIVTDTIEEFVPEGIRLTSGEVLEADIIVTATGLRLQLFGGAQLSMDGEPVDMNTRYVYRGCMIEGLPNIAQAIGYTNASWTLRSDLSSRFFCRVLNHVVAGGYSAATPRVEGKELSERPLLDLNSGYVERASGTLPKSGDRMPWSVRHNYVLDSLEMRRASVLDEMEYSRADDRVEVEAGSAPAVA